MPNSYKAENEMRNRMILLLIPVVLIVVDQITKMVVYDNLMLSQRIPVFDGFFFITHVQNPGSAFGMFANLSEPFRSLFLGSLAFIALGLVIYYSLKLKSNNWLLQISLHMIFAGAIGNLIDRIIKQSVTDFLLFTFGDWSFPAFNVADSCIVVGVFLMLLDTIFFSRSLNGEAEKEADPAADALAAAADLELSGPRRPEPEEHGSSSTEPAKEK